MDGPSLYSAQSRHDIKISLSSLLQNCRQLLAQAFSCRGWMYQAMKLLAAAGPVGGAGRRLHPVDGMAWRGAKASL